MQNLQGRQGNVVKHAHADCIRMSLQRNGDTLQLSIGGDGDGFDPAKRSMGIGLLSMRERAEISGGRYLMKSVTGQGTLIEVSWRLDKLKAGDKGNRRVEFATA